MPKKPHMIGFNIGGGDQKTPKEKKTKVVSIKEQVGYKLANEALDEFLNNKFPALNVDEQADQFMDRLNKIKKKYFRK